MVVFLYHLIILIWIQHSCSTNADSCLDSGSYDIKRMRASSICTWSSGTLYTVYYNPDDLLLVTHDVWCRDQDFWLT